MSYLTLADFKLRFFQRLGLARLWDWTPQDARRVWELDAISTVCGLVNSSASLAAMEGLLVFHGVKVLRDGSLNKSKAGAGSIEPIPDLYFRLTRNLLDDGTIDALGDAANVSMQTFAAIRNGGEDHPSWCEVHVERDGAERFLESQRNYVAELVKDPRGIPAGEKLRPSEVLKFLVVGVDAPANPSAPEVSRAQDARHFLAENLVLEAAQLGHIKIQGKPPRGQPQQIDSEVFRPKISLSTRDNDLHPYSFIDVFEHEQWTDLRIDGESFRQWVQALASPSAVASNTARLPVEVTEAADVTVDDRYDWPGKPATKVTGDIKKLDANMLATLEAGYRVWIQRWPHQNNWPNEREDALFLNCSREIARVLRDRFAPSHWRSSNGITKVRQ